MTVPYKKKLIEVAIPLEAINAASAREKSIRHGHPSTMHLWWARRPLAACRAVLFAQLVDDPSSHPDKFPQHEDQEVERERLFRIIEDLVIWENSTNEEVLERARIEIRKSCGGELPPIYDPFSGGCSIPLEAQRLGLPAYGSDLNPVAVMIGKAMIEIPIKFKDMEPFHSGGPVRNHYRNAEGLAEDVKYYGKWMQERAFERIGHLYPEVDLPEGGKATVIAWIWSRTVPSPDPAFANVQVPIASSFALSTKKGKEAWIEPIVDKVAKTINYRIRKGGTKTEIEISKNGTKSGRGANFECLLSNSAIEAEYVKSIANDGRMGVHLIAVVAKGINGRTYLPPDNYQVETAQKAVPKWKPDLAVPTPSHDVDRLPMYGMPTWGDAFTQRQLVSLTTFSDLVHEARDIIRNDFTNKMENEDNLVLPNQTQAATDYAEAVSVYLTFGISKLADYNSTITTWHSGREIIRNTFSRQALPMTWDFSEVNVFSSSTGNWSNCIEWGVKTLAAIVSGPTASQVQCNASEVKYCEGAVISTDPPYYDNMTYSDTSDFFFCWMKRSLGKIYPDLFGVIATPKTEELIAAPQRHLNKAAAEAFFLNGMRDVIANMAEKSTAYYPTTIYYAFKQSEISTEGVSSTGWASFLQAVLEAGYSVVGTWPLRTEMANRMIASGTNALANSVVLVCRKKEDAAEVSTRAEFIRTLKRELPPAISELQAANIAPADMPQSAIGPGMAVFSRFKNILESDDNPMDVKTALQLINRELDEFLNNVQGEFDAETRFTITWYEQFGLAADLYGTANNISTARGISVESVKHAGIVESSAGKVRILKRDELLEDWDPTTDSHLTIWECLQYLVREHEKNGVSYDAAVLLRKMEDKAEAIKDLAYCLYDICANKRQDAKEGTAYNALIADWTELTRQAAAIHDVSGERQAALDL
jgi:putative DNA methylase